MTPLVASVPAEVAYIMTRRLWTREEVERRAKERLNTEEEVADLMDAWDEMTEAGADWRAFERSKDKVFGPAEAPTSDVASDDLPTAEVEGESDRTMTTVEAAKELGKDPRWVRQMIDEGKLRAQQRSDSTWAVSAESVEERKAT